MSTNALEGLLLLIFALAVFVAIFIFCRQFTLWYFRLNQIADDIAVIAAHYRSLRASAAPPPPAGTVEVSPPAPRKSGNIFAP